MHRIIYYKTRQLYDEDLTNNFESLKKRFNDSNYFSEVVDNICQIDVNDDNWETLSEECHFLYADFSEDA